MTDTATSKGPASDPDSKSSGFKLELPPRSNPQPLQVDVESQIKDLRARLESLELEARMDLFDNKHGRAQEESEIPRRDVDATKPGLNYVTWPAFQESLRQGKPFAIDVLVGEPEPILGLDSFGTCGAHRIGVLDALELSEIGDGMEGSASDDGQEPLPERIRINSRSIIEIVSKIHRSNISPRGEPVILRRPFKVLVFYQKEIRDWVTRLEEKSTQEIKTGDVQADGERDGTIQKPSIPECQDSDDIEEAQYLGKPWALSDVKCLVDFIDRHLEAKSRYLNGSERPRVSFSDIWHLFKPGDNFIDQDGRQAYRVIRVTGPTLANKTTTSKDDSFVIDCVHIDSDGQRLGPVLRKFHIPRFDGEYEVTSLDAVPIRFAKTGETNLVARGREFVHVAGAIVPKHYTGPVLDSGVEIDGTVMIDFEEALRTKAGAEWKPKLEHVVAVDPGSHRKSEEGEFEYERGPWHEITHDDTYVDTRRSNSFIWGQHPSRASQRPIVSLSIRPRMVKASIEHITADEFLIMNYRVFGFVLDTKRWAQLDIVNTTEMRGDLSHKFNSLVLPNGHKEMMIHLVRQHFAHEKSSTSATAHLNMSRGKGALTFLLHGPPGVGKSTGVMYVANMFKKPLLQITAGDVGSTAGDAEKCLQAHLAHGNRWGCIILIRDADIFFVERRRDSWTKQIVTVFCRIIDSFSGILFLVTNRVGVFDEAAMSRIHVSLYFPALQEETTLRIFKKIIDQIQNDRPQAKIDIEEIILFGKSFYRRHTQARWNGRQICNAFETAMALAEAKADVEHIGKENSGRPKNTNHEFHLRVSDFETVAEAHLQFSRYLVAVLGNWSSRAAESEIRAGDADASFVDEEAPPRARARGQPTQLPQPQLSGFNYNYFTAPAPLQQPYLVPEWAPGPSVQLPSPIQAAAAAESRQRARTPPPPTLPTTLPVLPPPPSFLLATPLSSNARPELSCTGWELFKKARVGRGHECAAIDVLYGEPILSIDMDASESIWWRGWPDRSGIGGSGSARESAIADVLLESKVAAELVYLPERIRIHSKPIVAILEQIHGEEISNNAVIMIRPFRALAYYEAQIRQKLQELANKLQERDAQSAEESSHTASEGSGNDDKADLTTSLQHLKCLVGFIDTTIRAKVQYLWSGRCSTVTFPDLWYLFKPGDVVIDRLRKQAYRVLNVTSSGHKVVPLWKAWMSRRDVDRSESFIKLLLVYVDCDGKRLGPRLVGTTIPRFDGIKEITSLPVYPLRFAEDVDGGGNPKQSFRERLITRGKMFVSVVGMKPMHYCGPTLDQKNEVDSQVVIDFEEAFSSSEGGYTRPRLDELIGQPMGESKDSSPCSFACCADEDIHQDAYAETKRNHDYISTLNCGLEHLPSVAIDPRDIENTETPQNAFTDDELVIMSYQAYGFILRSRKWARLDLAYLSPIGSEGIGDGETGESVDMQAGKVVPDGENAPGDKDSRAGDDLQEVKTGETASGITTTKRDTALHRLVLPEGHTRIVLSLIAQHFEEKKSAKAEGEETDIVRGKGKGLIILLHGAPGVGKTTTAEGVAEVLEKPLFQITCGDLGDNATKVEEALERHFYLANRWGCVLLLDEADVFLAERSPQDLVRNGLVAVFLRILEYYTGILFLTTNRIGDFDEAFASRIHVSLYYPELKRKPTKQIFKLNLRLIRERITKRGQKIDINESGILRFASMYWRKHRKMRWNGRQIRNACQIALALAEFDAQRRVDPGEEDVTDAVAEVGREVDKSALVQLEVHHLDVVARAYLEFMHYLKAIYGRDAQRRAKYLGIRARELVVLREKKAAEGGDADEAEEDEDDEETSDEEDEGEGAYEGEEEADGEETLPPDFAIPLGAGVAGDTLGGAQPAPAQGAQQTFPLANIASGTGVGLSNLNVNQLAQSLLLAQLQQQLVGAAAAPLDTQGLQQPQQLVQQLLQLASPGAAAPSAQQSPAPGVAGPSGRRRRQDQSKGRR